MFARVRLALALTVVAAGSGGCDGARARGAAVLSARSLVGQGQHGALRGELAATAPAEVVSTVAPMENPSQSNDYAGLGKLWPEYAAIGALTASAMALSGGGNRALAMHCGVLQQLSAFMGQLGYLSSVSGGSWAGAAYVFSDASKFPDSALLGAPAAPSALTMAKLKGTAVPSLTQGALDTMLSAGTTCLFDWACAVGKTYLAPFGLNGVDKSGWFSSTPAHFTHSAATKASIVAANPGFASQTFYLQRPGRPLFLATATAIGPKGSATTSTTPGTTRGVYPITISSLFGGIAYGSAGAPVSYEGYPSPVTVGGGTVGVDALGGDSPVSVSAGGTVKVPNAPGLALATVVGASSNVEAWGTPSVATVVKLWPAGAVQQQQQQQSATSFKLGDGGMMDGTGLLAALQRGVTKAIVNVATNVELPSMALYDACASQVPPTFAQWPTNNIGALFDLDGVCGTQAWCNNQVFERRAAQDLLCQLQTRFAAGNATVVTQTLALLPNELWGIPAADKVTVVWIYLTAPSKFLQALPQETQSEIAKGAKGAFAKFPGYAISFQNGYLGGFSLTVAQINLLVQLAGWMVAETMGQFSAFFAQP